MTAPYECGHTPRCACAQYVESLYALLCDAMNERNETSRERDHAQGLVAKLTVQVTEFKRIEKSRAASPDLRATLPGPVPPQHRKE